MKKEKTIYWSSTVILGVMMLFSAFNYFTNDQVKSGFIHLGFSDSFRIELGIAKIAGAIVLLFPLFNAMFKQMAYFGFALTFISASIAHFSAGDSASMIVMPLIFLVVLSVSWIYYFRIHHISIQKSGSF